MASKKKKITSIKKRNPNTRYEKGKMSEKYIFAVVALLLLGVGIFFLQSWKNFKFPFMQKPVAVMTVIKPKPDFGRARQMTIYPEKDNIMQIVTREKVRVTLEVPKGAVKEKIIVKLIPFFYDKTSESPTAGVLVNPGSIGFLVPVTLSFNFSESQFKNQAPKNAVEKKLRTTGLSQVLQVDANATSFTPTLIARGIETETFLPARILSGGAYVFSLDGKNQVEIAKKALDKENMHTLTVMESATTLLFHDETLTNSEMKKTKAAVAKILAKPTPLPFELFAALILQKKITNKTFSLIPQVYAYETGEGFYQAVCRDDKYSVEEYLGFAKAAQLMGHDNIGESCLNKAKNKIEQEAKKLLAGNPDLKSVMIALQNVQLVGLDGETNLDEQLVEKAKEVATQDAKKVAENPNSTAIEAAVELQKMEAVGADSGPTYEKLKKQITDIVDQKEAAADKASEDYQKSEPAREAEMDRLTKEAEKEEARLEQEYSDGAIQEEEIMSNAAMSALGIGMLKAFGFEELDKDSLKKKFDEMQEQTKMVVDAGYEFCVAMRAEGIEVEGQNCEKVNSDANDMLKQAESESYRAEEEIGRLQSQEYEQPEYLDNQGDVQLYFEEEVTPTPGGDDAQVDENTNENNPADDIQSTDTDNQQSEDTPAAENPQEDQ